MQTKHFAFQTKNVASQMTWKDKFLAIVLFTFSPFEFWSELNKRVMCFLFEQNMPSKDWYIEISNKHYKQKSNPKNADKTLEYDCTMVSPQKPFSVGGYVENIQWAIRNGIWNDIIIEWFLTMDFQRDPLNASR